ncbi:MAG: hypothetical protein A2W98_12495 [Bacteroidetes bacterium GWF2_33_38]|nr:MAG: hypothetical protein A2W98_12495 [Bacteroidetes bacterium GWF2_33_38]OFY72723.1 MAG: hypothetical protein A2265_03595 [Bacteroidetes bacterium RIFOXYA12_FULL_33_9]OFY87473.1 MAG: hypothetical protein A2236_00130 [Bacteroidetes bacterium RIFOXYA2_FULL_33_7]
MYLLVRFIFSNVKIIFYKSTKPDFIFCRLSLVEFIAIPIATIQLYELLICIGNCCKINLRLQIQETIESI